MGKREKITTSGNVLTKESNESRTSKVNRIKSAVKQGTYSIDTREVAKSVVKHTKDGKKLTE